MTTPNLTRSTRCVCNALPSLALSADSICDRQATVVFISNVGAAHQALFIAGSALTFVTFSITLLTERTSFRSLARSQSVADWLGYTGWLRHVRRIPGALQKRERNADIAAVVFGILGGIALLLLS